jgi:hypothetical protein
MLLSLRGKRRPSLAFNFLSAAPVEGLTYTLTGGGLTYFDNAGTLQTAAAALWPLDHDPVTLAPRGRPVWSQRANDLPQSNDFTSGAWDKVGLPVTVTAGQAIGPDGLASLTLIEASGGSAQHVAFSNSVSVTAGVTRTLTAYARAGAADWVLFGDRGDSAFHQAWFNLTTGAVGATRGTVVSKTMTLIRPGLYLLQVTYTRATTGTEVVAIGPAPADNTSTFTPAGESINAGFVMAETGAFATAYVATAGAAATRNAPSITRTLGAELNAAAFTFTVGYQIAALPPAGVTNFALAGLDDGTSNNSALLRVTNTVNRASILVTSSGSLVVNSDMSPSISANTNYVAAAAVQANDFAGASRGVLATDASGAQPTGITTLRIGNVLGTQDMEAGWFRSFALYPTRLPNTTLQALTT